MHVGCCENCRYIDLVENLPNGCPRCGGSMVSLGVESSRWNEMNAEGKKSLIIRMLTEPKLRPQAAPEVKAQEAEAEADPEKLARARAEMEEVAETRAELLRQAETRNEQVRQAEEALEEARQAEAEVEAEQKAQLEAALQQQSLKEAQQEYVFVCCKCNTLAKHDRSHPKYYCTECGAEMVNCGYTTQKWANLSKEEKRKVTKDAQLRHMYSAIAQASDDDGDVENTLNIVNVVQSE